MNRWQKKSPRVVVSSCKLRTVLELPILNIIIITLLLVNIVGCQNNSNQKKNQADSSKQARERKIEKPVRGLNCDTTIVANELSYGTLAFKVFKADTNKIKSLFLDPVILKMEKKTNDQGGTYQLYNFTDGINKISLFSNDGGFYIEDAEIKNDRVLLNKKISVGMKQAAFLELLKVKNIKCDTISVADEESTFESVYVFKDGKLQQIKMGRSLE